MTPAQPKSSDALARTIRAEVGRGDRITDRLRDALEPSCGADLEAVRLHDDDTADRLAGSVGADAFTTGADVFFRSGAFRLDSDAGLRLFAHELAHVVQQAAGHPADVEAEAEAESYAGAFAAGRLPTRPLVQRATPLRADDDLVLQRHASWEHRMLGDLRTLDFSTIAGGGAERKAYLQRVQQFLAMWQTNPKAVTAARIRGQFPELRPLVLQGSGLVVTYGELNTLADYLATPADLDRMPEKNLLPILQQVRQEGFAWVTWVIEDKWWNKKLFFGGFENSVADTVAWDSADAVWETHKMDAHTDAFGPRGIDHYSGLLARNACHFAPHSWYRWEQFYLQARAFAVEAHNATGTRRDRLEDLAWIHHGYADHFLHDSFAAGHLVNKTLVMQWYLDWVGNTWTPVPDWDLVQFMTVARQPDLAGRQLYSAFDNPAGRGAVRDPQTASEHWSLARRMAVAGVRADGSTVDSSYKRWLAFLSAGVVQLASNTVHDHFNSQSLMVSSKAHPAPFQIYGDNTMIQGGEGYQIASATAQLSQRSIIELLANGTTTVTASDIASRFPSAVHNPAVPSSSQSLQDWAYGYRDSAFGQFDALKNAAKRWVVGGLRMRLAPVNIDNTGGWSWVGVPGQAVDIAVGGDGAVWSIGPPGPNGDGPVQVWNPASASWQKRIGAGTRIAVDGAGVVWLVNTDGDSFRRDPGTGAWEKGQRAQATDNMGNTAYGLRDIAAGTDGSVWALSTGRSSSFDGYILMRCIPGNGTHGWQSVAGAGVSISVGPDGLPWAVTGSAGVARLKPGTGPDRYRKAGGATWVDVSATGPKATDIGLGVGTLLQAWVTTDQGICGWNGRQSAPMDWENLGGGATRIATGPDGLPWVVNREGGIWRLVPGETAVAPFATSDAGKVTGTALASAGSLFQGETVSINGSTDLSTVIVGNSGARVYSIKLDRSSILGVFYQLSIDGQGPAGVGSGSMYIYLEDEGGFTDYKQFFARGRHVLTIDYDGKKAGITRISWSDGNDPRPPH